MRVQFIKRLLRFLIVCLAAGAGIALAAGVLEWYRLGFPDRPITLKWVSVSYIGAGLLFGIIGFTFSRRAAEALISRGTTVFQRMEKLPFPQLMSAVMFMILGLAVAAMLTNIVDLMGPSVFTTAFSAILYVCLGAFGYTVGYARGQDFHDYLASFMTSPRRTFHRKTHRAARKGAQRGVPDKLLDSSSLIDGRIISLCRIGFVEGDIIIPDFIVEELHHMADSQDASKRSRGQRGLDTIVSLQGLSSVRIRTMEEKSADTTDTDVRLLRLAKDTGAVVITGDANLAKVASVSSLPALNLHELASVMRPTVLPGQTFTAQIIREGREAGQGIAYMDDGTMIVVEGGRNHVGETLPLLVTSSLQTNSGRMVFAKIDGEDRN